MGIHLDHSPVASYSLADKGLSVRVPVPLFPNAKYELSTRSSPSEDTHLLAEVTARYGGRSNE